MAKKTSPETFAEQFVELESIIQWFEGGEMDLDQGLDKFKRAMVLSQVLKERLTEAENQITRMREDQPK